MIHTIAMLVTAAILIVLVTARTGGRPTGRHTLPRNQLHLAEAPEYERFEHAGREWVVVRDERRVRVVST